LINIPATIFATAYYEFLMRDSIAKIAKGHGTHEHGDEGLMRHLTKTGSGMDRNMDMEKGTTAMFSARPQGYENGKVE